MTAERDRATAGSQTDDVFSVGPDVVDDSPDRDRVSGEAGQPARLTAYGVDLSALGRQRVEPVDQVASLAQYGHLVRRDDRAEHAIAAGQLGHQGAVRLTRGSQGHVATDETYVKTKVGHPARERLMD
jgi:hypothetical protein